MIDGEEERVHISLQFLFPVYLTSPTDSLSVQVLAPGLLLGDRGAVSWGHGSRLPGT